MTMKTISRLLPTADNSLATSTVPRLFPRRQLLPIHPCRHALRCHRLRGFLMGK